ncbi:MAG: sodium:solute symporter [Flavobacteriales bacterium]|nr:sodium:solute symporter [Flavobacteriia bacterium]NCP05231.1 sodium:solute symporter [Flavobacteriales bacterium]PIV92470.1 MAG: sodium:solute symporter [Flavobacteriaceae bacterium CG17_big_fil_post_rev_8_21_14_2_50_33_15]PIY10621.1 MAG: sodium:solute symporter [Flavobacteriaceae bacterium CG_4_10_14_3_um_filter_33_47]PJB19832.1 MAG: sodium:solute symporter [Flavobacteriaceae bacterium CG_4_9_14_3_um_filter_33_16]
MQALNWIDWVILGLTLLIIVIYGTWQTRGSKNVNDYLKGGNTSKWWTIGLSVMATQASAITFLSTPGQAFNDGMGFVQFYFGLPIAMIIICMVFIPLYHRLNVYTAYEFLEKRFDLKTRTLTAILFLIQRGLAAGITIFAPAIILSVVLGWDLLSLNILIGLLVIIYTVSGGTRAVNVTQKHQMIVIFSGMLVAFFLIVSKLPQDISFTKALEIAGASGKMEILDFSFNLNNRYTFWSGIIGGTFLMLSYFGTDQSQVQRYLSGKSVKEMQLGLLFNGLLKVPMQFFILLVGVMVFVFYQFNEAPLNFNPTATELVLNSEYADEFKALQKEQKDQFNNKQLQIKDFINQNEPDELSKSILLANHSSDEIRNKAKLLIDKAAEKQAVKVESNDKDYVFIHFILNNLPRGLIGLLLAVILSAAMSSTSSELNALGSTTTIDLYKRNTSEKSEEHMVKASKWFTFAWGIMAILVACIANLAENLIQLVNIIGSIFYGNVLGIFLIAFFFKFVKGNAVFMAAIITQGIVISLFLLNEYEKINLPFLWLNFVGCIIVITIAYILQLLYNHDKTITT